MDPPLGPGGQQVCKTQAGPARPWAAADGCQIVPCPGGPRQQTGDGGAAGRQQQQGGGDGNWLAAVAVAGAEGLESERLPACEMSWGVPGGIPCGLVPPVPVPICAPVLQTQQPALALPLCFLHAHDRKLDVQVWRLAGPGQGLSAPASCWGRVLRVQADTPRQQQWAAAVAPTSASSQPQMGPPQAWLQERCLSVELQPRLGPGGWKRLSL